jgi:hypothetical protein
VQKTLRMTSRYKLFTSYLNLRTNGVFPLKKTTKNPTTFHNNLLLIACTGLLRKSNLLSSEMQSSSLEGAGLGFILAPRRECVYRQVEMGNIYSPVRPRL